MNTLNVWETYIAINSFPISPNWHCHPSRSFLIAYRFILPVRESYVANFSRSFSIPFLYFVFFFLLMVNTSYNFWLDERTTSTVSTVYRDVTDGVTEWMTKWMNDVASRKQRQIGSKHQREKHWNFFFLFFLVNNWLS